MKVYVVNVVLESDQGYLFMPVFRSIEDAQVVARETGADIDADEIVNINDRMSLKRVRPE